MSAYSDSAEYKAIRKIAVEITVNWFKDNGSYIGIARLVKLIQDECIRLKNKGLWSWPIPDERTARRRVNYTADDEFYSPQPAPLVCLGTRLFMGEDDSVYIPNRHSVSQEYRQHLEEFLPQGQQAQLQF